jgi:hypothetical protein
MCFTPSCASSLLPQPKSSLPAILPINIYIPQLGGHHGAADSLSASIIIYIPTSYPGPKTTQAGNDVSNTVPWIEICE